MASKTKTAARYGTSRNSDREISHLVSSHPCISRIRCVARESLPTSPHEAVDEHLRNGIPRTLCVFESHNARQLNIQFRVRPIFGAVSVCQRGGRVWTSGMDMGELIEFA
jgi:hypothetical protein